MSDTAAPPPQMVSFLFQRVQKLEEEVRALKIENDKMKAWAREQHDFYADQANEAGQFFDVFGTE